MQIYDVLKKDHQAVLHLLEQMENTSDGAVQKRRDLLTRLSEELVPHMRAEEKVLYDTLKEINETEDLVLEAEEEHSTCEMVLHELQSIEPSDKRWAAKLAVLKENLELHIEEEETEIFAQAKQVLAPEEAKMMAEAFKNLKAEVAEGGILESALNRVAQFMPPRFSKRFTEISRRLT
jgi:hemerythrin-like domain-containing protein